ncbi:MAG: type VI secretion system protein [Rhodospirillales bacterium]
MGAVAAAVQGYEVPLLILFLLLSLALGWWLWVLIRRDRTAKEEAAAREPEAPKPPPEAVPAEATILSPALMRTAFRNGLALYRSTVAGARNPHVAPWFLAVAPKGAGLTTLCAAVDTPRPPAETPDPQTGRPMGCTWWYHDQAVVIEASGDAFVRAAGERVPDGAWVALLEELVAARGALPIDGIILAVPADELVGPTGQVPHLVAEKAAQIYARLSQAQKITGLSLPVWTVITRCDAVPGFRALIEALPEARRSEAFGWSSPYPLDAAFRAEWIDEAMAGMQDAVVAAGLEIAAVAPGHPGATEILDLPGELSRLRGPLAALLGTIFRRTAYEEALYFRGLWFTGTDEPPAGWSADDLRAGSVASGLTRIPLAFARDLLTRKIFAERDLPRTTPRWSAEHSRKQTVWRAVAGGVAVLSCLLLWQGISTIGDLRAGFLAPLRAVADPVRVSREVERSPTSLIALTDAGAPQAIRALSRVEGIWNEPLFPVVWADSLGERVTVALAIAHWRLLMADVRQRLERRAAAIGAGEFDGPPQPVPGQSPELLRLRQFLGETILLERFIAVYNRLVGGPDLAGLTELVRYTHGIQLPASYAETALALQFAQAPSTRALRGASIDVGARVLELQPLRTQLVPRLERLADQYYAKIAGNGDAFARLQATVADIDALAGGPARGGLAPNALEGIRQSLAAAADALNAQDGLWLGGPNGAELGGSSFQVLLRVVGETALLGPAARERIVVRGRVALGPLGAIGSLPSSIGPLVVAVPERNRVELSPAAAALRTQLAAVLARPFMQGPWTEQAPDLVGRGGLFRWDVRLLEQALALVEDHALFAARDLATFPAAVQAGVRAVAQLRLTHAVADVVVRAQVPVPAGTPRSRTEGELTALVAANAAASPMIFRLAQSLRAAGAETAGTRLVEIASAQALVLLGRVDALLASERLYLPPTGGLAAWTRGKIDVAAIYGQADLAGVTAQLEVARQRVQTLAGTLADPLVGFLTRPEVRTAGDSALARRWLRIVDELEKAAQNRPGASLTALERFITTDLPELQPNACAPLAPRAVGGAGDWFADQLSQVRAQFHRQCLAAVEDRVAVSFGLVDRAFREFLAGRYPFAPADYAATGPHAGADEVQGFYRVFDALVEGLLAAFADPSRDSEQARAVVQFLETMRRARPFMKAAVGLDDTEPGIALEARFRALPEREIGGRDIIEWRLTSRDTVTDNGTARAPVVWRPGDPLALSLRWARNAPRVPVGMAAPGIPAQIQDRTVTIAAPDPWALVTLTRQLTPRPTDWRPGAGRLPHMLAAEISTGRPDGGRDADPPAKVFVELIVRAGIAPGGERLTVPALPARVPVLPGAGVRDIEIVAPRADASDGQPMPLQRR